MCATEDRIDFYDTNAPFGEFSNFYETSKPLIYDGKAYPTSEHLYQALKFMGPSASDADLAYADIVRCAKSPTQCKLLAAQRVARNGYAWRLALNATIEKSLADKVEKRKDWDAVKIDQMHEVVLTKFTQDKHCQRVLLSTVGKTLVEHTTRDDFWGDGGDKRTGLNHLGKVLMAVRDFLLAQSTETKESDPTHVEELHAKKQKT